MPREAEQGKGNVPGIIVFHFASSASEKNSEVFVGTKSGSASNLTIFVGTETHIGSYLT